jgi:hypothetical protein
MSDANVFDKRAIEHQVREALELISHDYLELRDYLDKVTNIRLIDRIDRRKGINRVEVIVEFEKVPPSLSISGSWIRNDVHGQIKGYLIGKLGLPFSIDVNIQSDNFFELIDAEPTKTYIRLSEALERKVITNDSPFIPFMRRYDLRHIEMSGERILGPDIGAMLAIEKIISMGFIEEMADLFTGTGSLIKVALMNGVKKAYGIDLNVSSARDALSQFGNRVQLYEGDTFTLGLPRPVPLVVADPTMPLCYRLIREMLPSLRNKCKLLLLVHGHTEHTCWNRRIRLDLTNHYSHVFPYSAWAMEMAICTDDPGLAKSLNSTFSQ